ncbi:MAG: hypothetical protein C5B57_08975 [Blastocatellia bacterium]|nr:MAG: hypothetical protein C5B57_08975 [Blastocatellia bacterium]
MRIMLPREHGVYGQMLFPLATALLVGRPTVPAFALVAAGVFAFLAHESLLVVSRPTFKTRVFTAAARRQAPAGTQ